MLMIREHVTHRVSYGGRGCEDALVVAVHVEAATRAHQLVEALGDTDRERAHPIGHGATVVGFGEEMNVIAEDGEVHDAKPFARTDAAKRAGDAREAPLTAKVPHVPPHAKRDVMGMTMRDVATPRVRNAGATRRRTATRVPRPRRRGEHHELVGTRHDRTIERLGTCHEMTVSLVRAVQHPPKPLRPRRRSTNVRRRRLASLFAVSADVVRACARA
jgi:hypothetical protein